MSPEPALDTTPDPSPDFDPSLARRGGRRRALAVAAALLLGLPASALGFHAWVNRDRAPAAQAAPAALPRAEALAEGLWHLRLSGRGYAPGYQHGTALREEVQASVAFLHRLMGGGALGAAQRDLALRKAWQLDACAAAPLREEMRGVADGAGAAYADVLLINTYDDLVNILGCSSAVALPAGGEPLRHGRNLDYPLAYLARHKVVFDIDEGAVKLRTVSFPGFVGVLTGMSSRGLSLTSHTSEALHHEVGEPTALLYRRMLEEAPDLDGMEALLKAARRTIGNNLALGDARRGQARALEFDAEHEGRRDPEGGRLIVTNHFQLPALQACQKGGWNAPGSGSSARVACLAQDLPASAPIGAAALEAALGRTGPGTAWRTPSNGGTVQSVIMEPATGRLRVAKGLKPPVTGGGYVELGAAW